MLLNIKLRHFGLLFLLATVVFGGVSNSKAAEPELLVLKGDLHCHSSFSHDSKVPVEQVIAESAIAGYDFITLTEHNTLLHLKKDHSTKDLLVISGYELTITPIGHFNIFGLRDFTKKSAIYNRNDMVEYLAYLKGLGGVIQLNHPNDNTYYSRFGYDYDISFLEILNGSFHEDDHQTLKDYQRLLCEGRKLIATGGTDAHKNHTVRKVFNNVFATERTEEAILAGLTAGRNYVTVEADGPKIFLSCGDTIMGGTVTYHEGQTVSINIKNIAPGTIIKVYTSNGLEVVEKYSEANERPYIKEVSTKGIRFCRVELWFDEKNICAYSNPIYIQQ